SRDFRPDKVKVQWEDYKERGQNRDTPPAPKSAKDVSPTIAEAANKIKASCGPARAVVEFSKWMQAHLKYDASVSYESRDVASVLKHGRGHCGHWRAVFQQFCVHCGIPVRGVGGLNLYAPDGHGVLDAVKADYTNIHGWVEVYFPGVGWVEVEPAGGE